HPAADRDVRERREGRRPAAAGRGGRRVRLPPGRGAPGEEHGRPRRRGGEDAPPVGAGRVGGPGRGGRGGQVGAAGGRGAHEQGFLRIWAVGRPVPDEGVGTVGEPYVCPEPYRDRGRIGPSRTVRRFAWLASGARRGGDGPAP